MAEEKQILKLGDVVRLIRLPEWLIHDLLME